MQSLVWMNDWSRWIIIIIRKQSELKSLAGKATDIWRSPFITHGWIDLKSILALWLMSHPLSIRLLYFPDSWWAFSNETVLDGQLRLAKREDRIQWHSSLLDHELIILARVVPILEITQAFVLSWHHHGKILPFSSGKWLLSLSACCRFLKRFPFDLIQG